MKWPINKKNLIYLVLVLTAGSFAQTQDRLRNASTMLRQTAQMYERAGQTTQAAEYYSRACRENPADVSAYLGAKRAFLRIGEYQKFEALIQSLQKQRRDLRYEVDLALIDFRSGNEANAKSKWRRVLQENPSTQQAYTLVGQAMVENQLYDEAVTVYNQGRRRLNQKTVFMFELASIHKLLKQFDDLIKEYAVYLETNPAQFFFIQSELQRLGREEGNTEPLLKELNRALKTFPSIDWALHIFIGDQYAAEKQFSSALLHYIKAENKLVDVNDKNIKRNYKWGKTIYSLGEMALKENESEEAEKAFLTIIQQFSESTFRNRAELGLTQVYLQRSSYEQAIASLEAFVSTNKKSLDARRALIMIGDIAFEHLFQIDRAQEAYSRALYEFPNNRMQIEALFKLSNCAVADDSLNQAASLLADALKKSGPKDSDLKKNALLNLARIEFFRAQPTLSLDYLRQFSEIIDSSSAPDVLENDALELSIILQENVYDSSGVAVLGQSMLLAFQHRYHQAVELLDNYLNKNPNVLLRSELRLQLADVYHQLNNYDAELELLLSVYNDQESLLRDTALMKAATIFKVEKNDAKAAQERYELILEEFPNSVYIEQARTSIRELRDWRKSL